MFILEALNQSMLTKIRKKLSSGYMFVFLMPGHYNTNVYVSEYLSVFSIGEGTSSWGI